MTNGSGQPPASGSGEEGRASDDTPPFGVSWTTLYLAVLLFLVLLIAVFTWFTRAWR